MSNHDDSDHGVVSNERDHDGYADDGCSRSDELTSRRNRRTSSCQAS